MESVISPVAWWDIQEQLWHAVPIVRIITIFIPFTRCTRGVTPTVLAYARGIKAELPTGGKLGVAGFCWGGFHATKLSQDPAVEGGKYALVDAHFTAHPSGLKTPEDFIDSVRKFKVPFSMAIVDRDIILKKEAVVSLEAALRQEIGENQQYYYELKIYQSCGHGLAVRADPKKAMENEAAGKASEQAVDWFKKFLVRGSFSCWKRDHHAEGS